MGISDRLVVTVSSRGQVTLPKAVRERCKWEAGTRLVVENTTDGVLLKQEPVFASTRGQDVFGALAYEGAPKTLAEMDAAVLREALRRHARRSALT